MYKLDYDSDNDAEGMVRSIISNEKKMNHFLLNEFFF